MEIDGNRIKALRLERFLTQRELAKNAGITEATMNRIETGVQNARISTIRKIAEALGVEPGAIVKHQADPGDEG